LVDFQVCGWATASLSANEVPRVGDLLPAHPEPAVAVATCQRLEVYHEGPCECRASYRYRGRDALNHLAEVAAGLHSAVLGEDQILGQVRDAWANADGDLARLGAMAIGAARRLRDRRELHADAGELLDRALTHMDMAPGGRIAVVGTGVLGRRVAHRARELGYEDVIIAGRHPLAASGLSHARWVPLADLAGIPPVDVVVTCLGADAPELYPDLHLPPVTTLVVDLGTPRNVAGELPVPVVTIAALLYHSSPDEDPDRAALRDELHAILDDRIRPKIGRNSRSVGELRAHVERLRESEAARIRRLHPQLDAETVDIITRSLVNRIFHVPSSRLRDLDDEQLGQQFAALFAPEEVG
jgi:glutamyl-tRNA reductase